LGRRASTVSAYSSSSGFAAPQLTPWNMLGALILLPALACVLYRHSDTKVEQRETASLR
jgi:hypothetical protein